MLGVNKAEHDDHISLIKELKCTSCMSQHSKTA